MDRKLIDLTGKTFGRLTVLRRDPNNHGPHPYWECECTCGTRKSFNGQNLRTGHTKSCGCWLDEIREARKREPALNRTPEYRIWHGMLYRCRNPHSPSFKDYGARGITVDWSSFEDFLADMGPRPTPQHTIERIDNNSSYSKSNCAWIPKGAQALNTRRTINWTFQGVTQCIMAWAQTTGIDHRTLRCRYFKLGWSVEKILTTPTRAFNWRSGKGRH